jgi:hypothetical protein
MAYYRLPGHTETKHRYASSAAHATSISMWTDQP